MDKSSKRAPKEDNLQVKSDPLPSEQNPSIESFDEADPLHDRTPIGDAGPEDIENTKGFADESKASY